MFRFSCFYLGWMILFRRHRFLHLMLVYTSAERKQCVLLIPPLQDFYIFLAKDMKPTKFQVQQTPINNLLCMGTKIFLMFLFINSLASKAINSIMSKLPHHFLLRKQYCPSCVIFSGYYKKKKKKGNKIKNYPGFPISNYLHHMQLSGGFLASLIARSAK